MSTIIQNNVLTHQDTGIVSGTVSRFTTHESVFTTVIENLTTAAVTVDAGSIITPKLYQFRLISGDDALISLDGGGTFPIRLSGEDDMTNLRVNFEGKREITSITTGADTAGNRSGDYIDLTDRNGTVRVWFNMSTATAATGSITYGTPAVAIKATGVLTLTANPTDGETVVVGATTYTFKPNPGDMATPNNVLMGGTASESIDNLIAAITFDGGAGTNEGTLYGTGTVANASATATAGAGDTMNAEALTAGHAGNSIATTETLANGSWTNATLTGGFNRTAVVVNGTTFSYVASAPGANEFSTIGELNTLVNALASISSTSNGTVITITADTAGAAGNAITLALGANTTGTLSVSGATLTGGADASTPPATPGGGRLLPVVYAYGDTADTIAAALSAALDADDEFISTVASDVVTVTDQHIGTRTDVADGAGGSATGWTLSVTQQGAAGLVVQMKSVGTSQVVATVVPN